VAGTDYQAPISLTTIGSSGVATFNGTTLNIPQYAGGASSFSALSDASSASLTADKIYLPAITMLAVTANGSTAYRFDQYGMADDPTVYAISGTTIAFNLSVTGHPFLIRTSGGVNYNDGLVHVSTTGVVSTGASAQGQVVGTLYWKIPAGTTGNYQYICSIHSGMVGVITIKDISAI
jgi:plastocyanin